MADLLHLDDAGVGCMLYQHKRLCLIDHQRASTHLVSDRLTDAQVRSTRMSSAITT